MTGILAALLVGILAGTRCSPSPRASAILGRSTTAVIILLLFVLGVIVGRNEAAFERLPDLGLVSLGVAWSCMLGSALVARLALRFVTERAD